ncbi:hypothetical protein HBI56_179310 [Parastagonospora nodorum]|uniref:Uncharacterized protein n=1 Tax=Phaeosphaeria nodorum (strain SN15 / ATCC MYA-4574 / FGSC 10173) TaxID=321614 RepID=A0A7U2ETT0_PHANO|nr:hypothetical protein HBH56_045950 [Parastagonospora nodorum]QRC92646.1 hypothetical protein JI435_402800 [Parastagonospora nodorum SN15]KAH3932962.1 hypothetical protein HBH54_073700 [Parastagonospora nodorum]KAH3946413.1 hypothetical protein HBH53_132850 [Parastagonospora nodorum]KAH3973297.1 hypothetical protein HBH52_145750 [Parastagonospora nodorum]
MCILFFPGTVIRAQCLTDMCPQKLKSRALVALQLSSALWCTLATGSRCARAHRRVENPGYSQSSDRVTSRHL